VDLLVYLIIWIGKAILKAHRQGQERRQEQASQRPGPASRPSPARPGPQRPAPARPQPAARSPRSNRVEQVLARLEALADGAAGQDDALAALSARFGALGGTGRVFVRVIDERLRPELSAAAQVAADTATQARNAPGVMAASVLSGARQLPAAQRTLDLAPTRIALLTRMAGWREDPAVGGMLADADAIAAAMWQPLQDFATHQGLQVPRERPVTAPVSGAESMWPDLLPAHTPVVVVPDDYQDDLFRQASVAHEIAHLVWLRVPRLASQTAQVMDLQVPPRLLVFENGRVRGTLHQPFSGWLEEIFCDAMTVSILGPSGLRGLVHSFAAPADPESVTVAHATGDGGYAPHPPPHLRVHMAARTLARMGFDADSQSILADWDRQHEHPDAVILPCAGGVQVRVGQQVLLDFIAPRLEAWYDAELPALSGFRIESIPGWMMTPGLWARVRRRAAELAEGKPFHDDGRVVLAAAIEARRMAPDQAARIAKGLRRAVLGRDAGERRVKDPNYTRKQAHGHDHRAADEFRDALLLGEILGPPAFRRRRAGARLG
jgi:hypothetical protein